MPDRQQQQLAGVELADRNRAPPRERMPLRHDDLELFVVDGLYLDAGRFVRQRENRGVELARFEQPIEIRGHVLLDVERHLGRELAQRDDELRQQIWRDRVNDAEAQAVAAFALLRDGLDARRLVERAPRLRDDLGADLRELDAALAALEHAHAELLLDVLDRGRQARLAHERALGGAAEMLLVGDGDQILELRQCHAWLAVNRFCLSIGY